MKSFWPKNTNRTLTAALLISATSAASGCGPEIDGPPADIEVNDQPLYVASSRTWSSPSSINLCWENDGDEAEKSWIIGALRDSWQGASSVRFTGLARCTSQSTGLRVNLFDENSFTRGLGTILNGVKDGVNIERYATAREVRAVSAHEFGHALGFAHEQNRPDTPDSCTDPEQGSYGDETVGAFDWDSVMNYCNPVWNGNGILSPTDIEGVTQYYGTGASEACGGLAFGKKLTAGASVFSCDRQFKLIMQPDGNLVLYKGTAALWATGTDGSSAREARMQEDGNLVLYRSNGTSVWSSGTYGNDRSNLSVQVDGNVVIYSERGEPIWSSGTNERGPDGWSCGLLRAGESLEAGQRKYSCDDRFELVMQRDGNLVLYRRGLAMWASGTDGSGGRRVTMQPDGNLVVYNASGGAVWASNTDNNPGTQLLVQNDGNVVLYTPSGSVPWATDTSGF